MDLVTFQERVVSGDVDMQTLDGFKEFAKFLVVLFNNPDLTEDKVLDVSLDDLFESLTLDKIEEWLETFQPKAPDGENGTAEKK